MAIKKHISWDGYRFRGYVDIGTGIDDDTTPPVAKDAIVFMVLCINGSWKVSCAYFRIEGPSGERTNIAKLCIQRLLDAGFKGV